MAVAAMPPAPTRRTELTVEKALAMASILSSPRGPGSQGRTQLRSELGGPGMKARSPRGRRGGEPGDTVARQKSRTAASCESSELLLYLGQASVQIRLPPLLDLPNIHLSDPQ